MSQRFSLDRQTFESFLAAASLIQELQDQAVRLTFNSSERVGLHGLVETQQAIQTGALDLEAACFQVTSLALKLTGAQGAGVWLFTEDTLAYRAGAGTASNSERLRLAVLAGLAETKPSSDAPELKDSIRCSKAKSLLVAPIYRGPKLAGALAAFSERENAFSDREEASTRLLAGILAHAVDKAAEAELKQSVALERAAMQKVVERLIPSLMRLASQDHPTVVPLVGSAEDEPARKATAEGALILRADSPRGVKAPAGPCETAADVAPQEPEDILTAVGSLRRPERNFAREEELVETNPRWVHTLNPGFERWVPIGPKERASSGNDRDAVLDLGLSAETTPLVGEEKQLASSLSQSASHCISHGQAVAPASGPQGAETVPLPLAADAVALPPFSVFTATPTLVSGSAPKLPKTSKPVTGMSFFQIVKSAYGRLRAILDFRISVRFAFNYRPTLRAMSLGVTAALLGIIALVTLQSGESAMVRSLTAGGVTPHATQMSPVDKPTTLASKDSVDMAQATQSSVRPQKLQSISPVVETSHLRITDARASGALESLSRYEIGSLQRRAEYGDDSAAFLLAMAYEVGRGVPRSCTQAAKWVAFAARQGNAAAEYNLALRYRTADGVKANSEEAATWFRKAARRRYRPAIQMVTAETQEGSGSAGQP